MTQQVQTTQKKQKVKKVRPANIGFLISLLEKERTCKYTDYKQLTKDLNEEFNLELSEDDVIDYHCIDIEIQDTELILKNCVL